MSRVFACLLFCCVLLAVPLKAQADFMRVTLLGTGSPRVDPDRAGSAVLVEAGGKALLFDAGEASCRGSSSSECTLPKSIRYS